MAFFFGERMKVSFTRGFDTDEVLKTLKDAKVEGLDEFVTNVAESIDKLSQFVQKNITLSDNVDQVTKSYLFYHNRPTVIDPPSDRKKVKVIIPIQSSNWDAPITSFNWRYNLAGKIEIKAWFLGAPLTASTVTMVLFH